MHRLRNIFISGIAVVLPAWLAVLLFIHVLVKLGVIVKPLAGHLPPQVAHPMVISIATFALICLLVGILMQTILGRLIGKALTEKIFNRIPGYPSLRAIARQAQQLEGETSFKPALIEVEDGALCPAFLVEIHDNGLSTVFIPSVPTPLAGSILIMASDRVHPLDVPVTTMMHCISKWGSGSGELLAVHSQGGSKTPARP